MKRGGGTGDFEVKIGAKTEVGGHIPLMMLRLPTGTLPMIGMVRGRTFYLLRPPLISTNSLMLLLVMRITEAPVLSWPI
jgi:hypothetical protein